MTNVHDKPNEHRRPLPQPPQPPAVAQPPAQLKRRDALRRPKKPAPAPGLLPNPYSEASVAGAAVKTPATDQHVLPARPALRDLGQSKTNFARAIAPQQAPRPARFPAAVRRPLPATHNPRPAKTPPAPVTGKQALSRSRSWFARHGLQGTYKVLQTNKQALVVSQTKAKGSFGKVSYARAANQPAGQRLAVKQIRERWASKLGKDGQQKTHPQSYADTQNEFSRMQAIHRAIAQNQPDIEKKIWPSDNPLASVRGLSGSKQMYELYRDKAKEKSYLISTLELGDVFNLHEQGSVPISILATVAGSMGAQVLLQLDAMHTANRCAHLDIKLANITFNQHGEMKLADFGLARSLQPSSEVTTESGIYGSLLAPEMLPPGDKEAIPLGTKTDVHAVCASVLEFIAGTNAVSPFFRATKWVEEMDSHSGREGRKVAYETLDVARNQQRLAAVEQLLRRLFYPANGPPKTRLSARDLDSLPETADRDVNDFFATCSRRAPEQTCVLLQGLWASPQRRSSARALAQDLGNLLPPPGRKAEMVKKYFANHANLQVQEQVFAEMQRYEQVLAAEVPTRPYGFI